MDKVAWSRKQIFQNIFLKLFNFVEHFACSVFKHDANFYVTSDFFPNHNATI